jgi:hypothetical protein
LVQTGRRRKDLSSLLPVSPLTFFSSSPASLYIYAGNVEGMRPALKASIDKFISSNKVVLFMKASGSALFLTEGGSATPSSDAIQSGTLIQPLLIFLPLVYKLTTDLSAG